MSEITIIYLMLLAFAVFSAGVVVGIHLSEVWFYFKVDQKGNGMSTAILIYITLVIFACCVMLFRGK